MKIKGTSFRYALLTMIVLTLGAATGPCRAQQQSFYSRMSPRPSVRASSTPVIATVITQVEVLHIGQQTVVRVEGNGRLTFNTLRLNGPERLVLDFSGAALSLARTSIPSAFKPVRGVRVGQFKLGVARVVIDLEERVEYTLRSQETSVTVEFDPLTVASTGGELSSRVPVEQKNPDRARQKEVTAPEPAPQAAFYSSGKPRPESQIQPAAAAQSSVLPQPKVEYVENAFENGLLTFRAKNHTLRSILEQIGNTANVAINIGGGLGAEELSVEFRHFRVDEALRQILKGYDALFFYGADKENQGSASLKAVWVHPPDRGPGINRSLLSKWESSTREAEGMLAHPDPDVRARAAVSLIRRKGRESSGVVLAALKDKSDRVRAQALYRALIAGAELPADTLIDLALTDESMNVRFLALQALPVDPTLRWVAERAAQDSSQQVSAMAKDILRELDAANAPAAPPAASQPRPPDR